MSVRQLIRCLQDVIFLVQLLLLTNVFQASKESRKDSLNELSVYPSIGDSFPFYFYNPFSLLFLSVPHFLSASSG